MRKEWPPEQPKTCVVGGCTPSISVLSQGQPGCYLGMSASMSSNVLLSCPQASSAGLLCGGTGPQASSANGRDPSPHGYSQYIAILMYHIQVLTSGWHQISQRWLLAKESHSAGIFWAHLLLSEFKQAQKSHSSHVLPSVEVESFCPWRTLHHRLL